MKRAHRHMAMVGLGTIGALCIPLLETAAFASETSGGWRPTYDLVLRWFNFGILAFLFIKFAKAPAKDFFASKRAEIADGLRQIEAAKKEIDEKMGSVKKALVENRERLDRLRRTILAEAERRKETAVNDAQQHRMLLLAESERKIDAMVVEANARIKSELLDAAIHLVEKLLPELLTEADRRRLVDQYITDISRE